MTRCIKYFLPKQEDLNLNIKNVLKLGCLTSAHNQNVPMGKLEFPEFTGFFEVALIAVRF